MRSDRLVVAIVASRLRASNAVMGEWFGFAVAASTDIVVFERRDGSWTQVAKLTQP